jgi:hypothetical protein
MLEVTRGVPGADRRERFAQYLYQGVLGAGSRSTQDVLDLGESLFDEPTTVRLCTPASSSGCTIILSSQLEPLHVSMVSARQFVQPAETFEFRFVGPHYPASSVAG